MKLLKSRKLLKKLVLLSKLSKGTVSNEIDKRLELQDSHRKLTAGKACIEPAVLLCLQRMTVV